MYDVIISTLTVVAAMTATMTLFTQTKKTIKQDKINLEEIECYVQALNEQVSASKAKALEMLVSKLPITPNIERFIQEIEKLLNQLEIQNKINLKQALNSEFPIKIPNLKARIDEYHGQALAQAGVQFWISIVAACIGFAWILYATIFKGSPSDLLSYFQVIPGVVVDTFAYLFFRQAEATRARATELYDRLRKDEQSKEATLLADSINDQKIKSLIKAQLSLHMAGLNQNLINLSEPISNIINK